MRVGGCWSADEMTRDVLAAVYASPAYFCFCRALFTTFDIREADVFHIGSIGTVWPD